MLKGSKFVLPTHVCRLLEDWYIVRVMRLGSE